MRSILQKAPSLLSFRQIEDNKSSLRKRSNSSSNSHSGRGGSSTSSTGSNNSSDSNTASAPVRVLFAVCLFGFAKKDFFLKLVINYL